MSHYSVGVITPDGTEEQVDKLLAPYDENLEVVHFIPKEELIERARERAQLWDKKEWLAYSNNQLHELALSWYEDEDHRPDGSVRSTYNPRSKWDWYVIGGRWDGALKTKDGRKVNSCRIRDLDLSPDQEAAKRAERFWEVIVEGAELAEGEKQFSIYKPAYYLKQYGNKESYVEEMAEFSLYALLSHDSGWHEPGEMGWFGMSDETKESRTVYRETMKRLLQEHQDDYITLVDCHI